MAIERIQSEGGTNISGGLTLAEGLLLNHRRDGIIRRILLLSDGEANIGALGPQLIQQVSRENASGIGVSAMGLGIYHDEPLMISMAEAGRGRFRYLENAGQIEGALAADLAAASRTVATDIALVLTPEPGVQLAEAYGQTPRVVGGSWEIPVQDLAAGESWKLTLAVHPGPGTTGVRSLVRARLRYRDVNQGRAARTANVATSALATADTAVVKKSLDREAAKVELRAKWGAVQVQAADAYIRQDPVAGNTILAHAEKTIGSAAQALGDAFLVSDVRSLFGASTQALSGATHATNTNLGMEYRSKSLSTFGTNQ
jgi:Ca-activated chloride channel family protein